ncbi:HAMP domain-containing protein [Roseiconus nitratireducens]|uniref:histidine kinase n=1 Tax=Roseiconus nitratireducens TaxID=2605748 RepID=A0A5M6D6R9_9BACT|nr:ATP-binding protein [Roseiconus nitratireducens]KAA5543043.1 HAMP domain-containing protein [Roseiconus nitratireducens]
MKRKTRRRAIPIRWKLFTITAVVGLVAAAIAISGLSRMRTINDRMNLLVDFATETSRIAATMKGELVTVTRAETNMVLAKSDEEMERHLLTIDTTLDSLSQNVDKLRPYAGDTTREYLDDFQSKWNAWQVNHLELRGLALQNSDVRARELSLGEAREALDRLDAKLKEISDQADETSPQQTLVPEIRIGALQLQRIEKNLMLASNEQAVRDSKQKVEPLRVSIREQLRALSEQPQADESLVAEASAAFEAYLQVLQRILDHMGQSSNIYVMELVYGIGVPIADECESLLDKISAAGEQEIDQLKVESSAAYINARRGLVLLSVIGIATSLLVSFLISDRIARGLGKLATYAREVHHARDLSRPIPSVGNDEVGQVADALDGMRKTVYSATRQLEQVNVALSEKSEEMEQFVYTVSHDLKSPLVSCKGLLGLMREDLQDQDYDEVFDSIARMEGATDQLGQIIDDLLELSRIGRKPISPVDVDVHAMLVQLADDLRQRVHDAGVDLRIQPNLPRVQADASDLRRLFDNLISNAVKYASDVEQPWVEVGGTQESDIVRYYVRDNGPGIEPDYQEKIFGLFQRLEHSKVGTGLGLASVRKIARMHGGRAWVESEPNQGATFWIELPKNSQAGTFEGNSE